MRVCGLTYLVPRADTTTSVVLPPGCSDRHAQQVNVTVEVRAAYSQYSPPHRFQYRVDRHPPVWGGLCVVISHGALRLSWDEPRADSHADRTPLAYRWSIDEGQLDCVNASCLGVRCHTQCSLPHMSGSVHVFGTACSRVGLCSRIASNWVAPLQSLPINTSWRSRRSIPQDGLPAVTEIPADQHPFMLTSVAPQLLQACVTVPTSEPQPLVPEASLLVWDATVGPDPPFGALQASLTVHTHRGGSQRCVSLPVCQTSACWYMIRSRTCSLPCGNGTIGNSCTSWQAPRPLLAVSQAELQESIQWHQQTLDNASVAISTTTPHGLVELSMAAPTLQVGESLVQAVTARIAREILHHSLCKASAEVAVGYVPSGEQVDTVVSYARQNILTHVCVCSS